MNEILNSHYDELDHLMSEENLESLNTIGTCGETPAHISIYKSDVNMLKMVLAAGYDVNLKNTNGDTIFHVAAKLGDLKSLELIYATGMCDLVGDNTR